MINWLAAIAYTQASVAQTSLDLWLFCLFRSAYIFSITDSTDFKSEILFSITIIVIEIYQSPPIYDLLLLQDNDSILVHMIHDNTSELLFTKV